jgi:predicted transport protein
MLYSVTKKLEQIQENPFKLEKEIQNVFENNLETITGFILIKSEFILKGKRFDSLAFNEESNSFVIIEYKRDKNFSVIDQGFTYLGLALENKADLVLEYIDKTKKSLKREDVDWSQTRVIFVSSEFTENQISASNFKDLAIDLYEIKRYKNDTIFINKIKKSKSAESIKTITKNEEQLTKTIEQIIAYNEEYHLMNIADNIKELYQEYKNAIVNLIGDVEIVFNKNYIAYKLDNKNIVSIKIQQKNIKLWINTKQGMIDDSKKISKNMANIGHHGIGEYEFWIEGNNNLEYIMSLIRQVI